MASMCATGAGSAAGLMSGMSSVARVFPEASVSVPKTYRLVLADPLYKSERICQLDHHRRLRPFRTDIRNFVTNSV